MAEASPQVLIVGAGPTGLSLACCCLRLGLRTRLVDKQPGPSVTSKAIGLQYRVSEVLACLGLIDRFVARSSSATRVNIYSGGRRLVQLKFEGIAARVGRDAFEPRALLLPQSVTEELLGQAVGEAGGRVEWNTELVGLEQDDARVTARLRHADGREELASSDWLVSCEGAHSAVRKLAGLPFTGKTYPLAFFLADVTIDGPLRRGENYVWAHPDGTCAAFPMPGDRKWRLLIEVTRQGEQAPGELTLDVIRALLAERSGDRESCVSDPTWVSEFRIHCRMVERYRQGRVFLAGDAAHIHSPTGGQGIVTGTQDAFNLAWKLARVAAGASPDLLDTYQEERLPKAREVLRETDRTATVFFAPTVWWRMARDLVVLPLLRSEWVQKHLFYRLAQLHVNYRGCRLSRHEDRRWFAPGLKAGDRAPDVAFRLADGGELVTLFGLLHPLRPVALIGPGADLGRASGLAEALARLDVDARIVVPARDGAGASPGALIDVHGDFRRLYGMTGGFFCLIRPDDHIGLFQHPIHEAGLRDYLRMICPEEAVARAFER